MWFVRSVYVVRAVRKVFCTCGLMRSYAWFVMIRRYNSRNVDNVVYKYMYIYIYVVCDVCIYEVRDN